MSQQIFALDEYFENLKTTAAGATITSYTMDSEEDAASKPLPAIIVFPGGGYSVLTGSAAAAAKYFQTQGFRTFSATYSIAPVGYPAQLLQAAAAVAFVRRNAKDFGVDPQHIAVMGFSAGGHLAASIGTLFNEPVIQSVLQTEPGECRPDAMVLCYPVITSGEKGHRGSFISLLGEEPDPSLLHKLSLENAVTDQTPPAFLWHTFEDIVAPAESSMLFAAALRNHNIPFELHIFQQGPHGLALCESSNKTEDGSKASKDLAAAEWKGLAIKWLNATFA